MWQLYFFIKFTICVLLGTLACVLPLLLPSKSGIVNCNVCWLVYSMLAKANISVNLAESRAYTRTSSEERKWDIGKKRVSMAHANGVIKLGESEIRA